MVRDETWDVVVVGFGLAGGRAAIEAHDRGARVLLIEKTADPGGISICAGGGARTVLEREGGFAYLKATTGGSVPDDLLQSMVDGMMDLERDFRALAKVNGAEISARPLRGDYPFPGWDKLGVVEVTAIPGFDPKIDYPHVRARLLGPLLFKLVHDNVRHRGIEIRLGVAAERLTRNAAGEVSGLVVRDGGRERTIATRKGVILACGGFEAAPEMQRRFWQIRPVLPAATLGNTGDGIRMAQAVGADLWHMWHFHGSYGFRHTDPAYPFAMRVKRLPNWTPTIKQPDVKMAWVLLDRTGRRFMNEYHPYFQDTGHRPLDVFDPVTQSFPNIPAFLLVDEEGRKLYPLGQAVSNDRSVKPYTWSADNMTEVANGILRKANSLAELAGLLGMSADVLAASLDDWNRLVQEGCTCPFGRPSSTMLPITKPPFYVGEVWPVVNNTQGGPVHDARQRVLTAHGEVVPRLYVAGELGSIWGYLYLGAGNLAECFITGRTAAADAASLEPLEA